MVHRAVTLADFVFGSGDDCGIDVLLGADDRFVQRQSMGEKSCYGRGERAARTVRVRRVEPHGAQRGRFVGFGVVEYVDKLGAGVRL